MTASSTLILQLALPSPLRRCFDYLLPEGMTEAEVQVGQRYRVPFGSRQLVGLLVGTTTHSEFMDKLKPAIQCLDVDPILPEHLLELATWSTGYYQHPIGDGVTSFLPTLLRKGEPAGFKQQTLWISADFLNLRDEQQGSSQIDGTTKVSAKERPPIKLTPKQQALLEFVATHPAGLSSELIRLQGYSKSVLEALVKKGLVATISADVNSADVKPAHDDHRQLLKEPELRLNAEQQHAFDELSLSLDGFCCSLLQGVTGSGKTEVYLQLIGKALSRGKQALVLVPEIGLTPQTVGRFQQRFNVPVAVMHSGMSDRERLDAWLMAQSGDARILIGTRSAVLTPMKSLGVIIIDEEHDGSYKQQEGFRYSARDLSVMRAQKEAIPIVLGSATPSMETYLNAKQGRYHWIRLSQRAGSAAMPEFELLDIRHQELRDGLSEPLINKMRERLDRDEQVMVFLNRRGFAPTLMCHDCGWVADCQQCDARYTLHRFPAHLHCHHCDHQMPIPRNCPSCLSTSLQPIGAGTERTEAALQELFTDIPVIRVDRDSTRRKQAMAKILEQIHQPGPGILLGTQMLAKGHHFPRVTLVAILDADAGLFSADFRGMEKTAQLILQVAGRAGRADKAGSVVMQTHCADHPRLSALIEQNYDEFAATELAERQQALLPPYIHYGLVRAEAVAAGRAETFLQMVSLIACQFDLSDVELIGPFPAPMEKRAGRYRAQLLMQSHNRKALHRVCTLLGLQLEQNKQAKKVRWSIDIDPWDMF